jgi:hypothetical protein
MKSTIAQRALTRNTMAGTMVGTLAAALATALLAGCATQPSTDASRVASNTNAKAAAEKTCVRETGSRIKVKEKDCIGPGRTYSRDELDNTGAFDTAEALRKVDPSIQ